jgi:hypothetical protein
MDTQDIKVKIKELLDLNDQEPQVTEGSDYWDDLKAYMKNRIC